MKHLRAIGAAMVMSVLVVSGCDGGGKDPTATVVAIDDASITLKDMAIIIDVLANDLLPSDPAGFPLTIVGTADGSNPNGVVTFNAATVTYTPNVNFAGTDWFQYTVQNSDGAQATAIVQVVVADPLINPLTFDPLLTLSTGGQGPSAAAVGDIDLDGLPDIVVIDQISNDVVIFIQDSVVPGTFLAPVAYLTGTTPSHVAIGDLDDDGLPDLAISNFDDDNVLVLFQDLTPTPPPVSFGTNVTVAVGINPTTVAIGDFDRDGLNDIVTSNSGADTISVVFQDSATPGSFFAPVDYATGSVPNHLAVADLDVDGALDVVIADLFSDSVTIYFGDPSSSVGAFITPPDLITDLSLSAPTEVTIDDLNGDGILDFAVSNQSSTTVSVYFQNAAALGTFPTVSNVPAEDSPLSLVSGDIDNDGLVDMAVTTILSGPTPNFQTEAVAAILQLAPPPGGTFSLPGNFVTTGSPGRLAAGDIDSDGRVDIVVPNFGSGDFTILFGN